MSQFIAKSKHQVESHIESQVARFIAREDGATMVEYGLMVALIAVVCIAGVTLLGGNVSGIFNNVAGKVATPA